ncbi:unnamed protein product [Lota lota]
MEDLKRTRLQDAPPDLCYAGPEDVGGDSHHQVAGLKRHKLVDPAADLQDNIVNICPRQDELMMIFCHKHRRGIYCVCAVDEHRGPDHVLVEAERNQRQQDLSRHRKTMRRRIQKVEVYLEVLLQEMDDISWTGDVALRGTDEICHETIRPPEGQRWDI